MKKLVSFAVAICILLVPVLAFAENSVSVRIDEYGITADFPAPDGWYLFQRGMDENDPAFAAYGLTKEQVDEGFEKNGIYYNSASPDKTREYTMNIEVTDKTESIHNYNILVEDKFEKMVKNLVGNKRIKSAGLTYTYYEIIKGEPATWVYYEGRLETNVKGQDPYTANLIDYNTVVNGVCVHLTFHSTEEITDAEKAALRAAVDSVKWDEIVAREISDTKVGKTAIIGGGLALALALLLIPHIRHYRKRKAEAEALAAKRAEAMAAEDARRAAEAEAIIARLDAEDAKEAAREAKQRAAEDKDKD
jgi:hypothetical protein